MLTSELIRPYLRRRGDRLYVTQLRETDHWQQTAADLIALFHQHRTQPQRAFEAALTNYEADRTDYNIIRGLVKVLKDNADFAPPFTPIAPPELRERLFADGPAFATRDLFHPQTRADRIAAVAAELNVSLAQIEATLFADRPSEYLLTDPGPDWTPIALIARYNLERLRAALYWSDAMEVEIHDNYKDFWRYLKLFKLMFWAQPLTPSGYHVQLDGPISPFVKATTRYGRQFAAFLPALFLSDRWQMTATVRPPQFDQTLEYRLDHTTPLQSHFRASGDYDSRLEADFAAEFADKFGDKRGQWLLTREDEVLLLGDTVMIPDFALTHKRDGRRALIEIVGFWHPEYLRRKIAKVRAAQCHNLLLLVYERVNLASEKLRDVPGEVLYFAGKPVLKDVLAAADRIAE
ncbi:MAG: DUF790 family protein [Chloroflexi bacterium]|nr:DUF790 family protein [Chloroflexota bacterium]